MNEIALKTSGLSKKYGKSVVLDDVDMAVYKGDIYALIGRNGAGKTTLMRVITGLSLKSGGVFELFPNDTEESSFEKKRLGCLIGGPAFFKNMTAYQNLRYYAIQKGITNTKQIDKALEIVGLSLTGRKKYSGFSLGMKQRLGIALALLDNPDLLILDEPINGLDPIGISNMRDTFKRLNSELGITIIVSSHILTELYAIANRFLFIDNGKVLKEITKQELDDECKRCIVIKTNDTKSAAVVLEKRLNINEYTVTNSGEINVYSRDITAEELSKALFENNISISGIYESGLSLEDYFKNLVEVR